MCHLLILFDIDHSWDQTYVQGSTPTGAWGTWASTKKNPDPPKFL